MSDFSKAIPVILQHEGGWVSNPADPGGETNFGISTLMVKRLQADEKLTNAQVANILGVPEAGLYQPGYMKSMVVLAAQLIYQKYFWDKYSYGLCSDQVVGTKVFDCAVNCGPGHAGIMAQKAANANGANLTVDGQLGAKSFAAINAVDPKTYVHSYADEMRAYYNGIVHNNPKLAVFLKNWLHRAAWGE